MSDYGTVLGSICHHEIPSPDLERQQAFYGAVFGWQFTQMHPGYVLFSDGLTGGGLDAAAQPSASGAVFVIATEEVSAALERIREAGGTPLTAKAQCGPNTDHGFYAYFRDPCGNRVGVWSRT